MGTETILRFFSIFPYVFQHGLVCSFFSFLSFIFLFYFFSGHFQNFSSMNEFGCLFVHTTTCDFVYVCVCLCMSVSKLLNLYKDPNSIYAYFFLSFPHVDKSCNISIRDGKVYLLLHYIYFLIKYTL